MALLAAFTGLALLAFSTGCGADGAGEAEGTAETEDVGRSGRAPAAEPAPEQTDVAADYEALADLYEQMAARHQSLAGAFGGAAAGAETDIGAGNGAGLYAAYCSSSHGPEGQGVSGAFPPLAGSPWVVGPAERAARIVLRGLGGPLEVAGETCYGVMPSFASRLDDGQVGEVLTLVRSSWGNQARSVTPRDVARIRAETEGRGVLTVEELEEGLRTLRRQEP